MGLDRIPHAPSPFAGLSLGPRSLKGEGLVFPALFDSLFFSLRFSRIVLTSFLFAQVTPFKL